MTKVDERAVMPEVDASLRRSLAATLEPLPVTVAYLIGSQATGRANAISDVDTAPLGARFAADRRHRIAEGRFGRR